MKYGINEDHWGEFTFRVPLWVVVLAALFVVWRVRA